MVTLKLLKNNVVYLNDLNLFKIVTDGKRELFEKFSIH